MGRLIKFTQDDTGRYDNLHGDEDENPGRERVSTCHECGSTDGCLCGLRKYGELMAVPDLDMGCSNGPPWRKSEHPCSLCGETPCSSPSACRSQARMENDEPDMLACSDDEETDCDA